MSKTHTQFTFEDHDFDRMGICPCGAFIALPVRKGQAKALEESKREKALRQRRGAPRYEITVDGKPVNTKRQHDDYEIGKEFDR